MRQVHNSNQWSGFPWAKWSCCWWQFILNHTKPQVLYWEILEIGRIAASCQASNKDQRERHLSLWNKVVTEEKWCAGDKIRTQDNLAVQVTNHCDSEPTQKELFILSIIFHGPSCKFGKAWQVRLADWKRAVTNVLSRVGLSQPPDLQLFFNSIATMLDWWQMLLRRPSRHWC